MFLRLNEVIVVGQPYATASAREHTLLTETGPEAKRATEVT